ncbi:MAG: long-chain-fatty-acid--CoA ligase [Proteobacteria bacterium]|nr:long-chain-fatty-acid--CoA ligase [Pseudomonadota bacterium]
MYLLGDIPRKTALTFPDREAVVFEGTRLTYRKLNIRINRLANALTGLGCTKGDRICVLAENTHKYLELYFAAAKLGISTTPLNIRLSDSEVEHIVNNSEAVCFFVGEGFEERVMVLKDKLVNIREWISLDAKTEGFLYYEEKIETSSEAEPEVEIDESEMAILMYTGGTTGLPKGVMMSHRNLMTAFLAMLIGTAFNKDDTTCFVLPLFHVSFWPALCLLLVGGKVVINRRVDFELILQLIQDEKCTHINAVPVLYQWLLMIDIEKYDLSSLRSMGYAGSPFPPEVLKQCIEKFGNIFEQGYGMTEALGLTGLPAEEHATEGEKSKLLASAGKAMPCAEVRVMDENDNPLKPGQIGEIVVKGKHVMLGYWKNPELTTQVLRNGWYHTGDMGYMNEEQYLFMVDRKADMIITGGENVYPKETEDVLYEHPAVLECAVVSAPDEKWGERVQAVVVLKPEQSSSEEELIEFCKEKLAGFKCPKSIEFWPELPKTPVQKILRKDVKKKFWEGQDRSIG